MKSLYPTILSLPLIVLVVIFAISPAASAQAQELGRHAQVTPATAEPPLDLLQRHGLDRRHLRAFLLLNDIKHPWQSLGAGKPYRLPMHVVPFDGLAIRTSLHIPMTEAVLIRDHNARLAAAGLKPAVTDDQKIWLPYDHVLARAGNNQKTTDLLATFGLSKVHVSAFAQLNNLDHSNGNAPLKPGQLYRLPIHIHPYTGPSIRLALDVTAHDAKAIQAFNKRLHDRSLKPQPWNDHLIWVPYHVQDNPDYGPIYQQFEVTSTQLEGCVFYLSPGHGGPDPGTSGIREGESICEDEYALDITLRLARELQRYGAHVEVLVKDEGIRDDKFLHCDTDERFQNGEGISNDLATRLRQRVDQVNTMYSRSVSERHHQRFLAIHIDFRTDHRKHIDFDLYHHPVSKSGRQLASLMQDTIERHYDSRLVDRHFVGRVIEAREQNDFYVIRETHMPAVLIELANMANESDQLRFIVIDSRQRIAEWLCEGLVADWEQTSRQLQSS